ncbi:MAG TPA: hypothetical protein VK932_11555 [Kofleriaceae bacterium]|nr:hypothetical protein [Kofleriaceae bacterium]
MPFAIPAAEITSSSWKRACAPPRARWSSLATACVEVDARAHP